MKARNLFFYLLFLTSTAFGQQSYFYHSAIEKSTIDNYLNHQASNTLDLQLVADASLTESQMANHKKLLNEWGSYFIEKQAKIKNQQQFISYLFYKVHRKLLKNYKPFTTFNETLTSGDYDCLSGTTLYATLLDALHVNFEIIETNYHIYLKVKSDEGKTILLESTDPIAGFIDNEEEIADRLKEYDENNNKKQLKETGEYAFQFQTNNAIDLTALAGLQYYNASVNAFNKGQIKQSILLFEKAGIFYTSKRFVEFGYVLANSLIANSDMTTDNKRAFLKRIPVIDGESVVSAF